MISHDHPLAVLLFFLSLHVAVRVPVALIEAPHSHVYPPILTAPSQYGVGHPGWTTDNTK